ncbi:MAG TPA: molybdopterin cofactor-binding domain-containing protein [Gaiellaceae bacterium]|jgi:CO/xanthine dehydrogenase Mo-binding subunit|nr:molybdopterin cofactor-binding domain-containing protein [Gaiellaceae bacterium]
MTALRNEKSSRGDIVAAAVERVVPGDGIADSLGRLVDGTEVSRATFLKGGGALILGFSFAGSLFKAGKAEAANGSTLAPPATAVDSWVTINPDNTATILIGKVELGQGSPTGLLMIAAEELDLGMDQIRQQRIETGVTPDQGFTAGSTSISGGGPQVRQAAAEARLALLTLASANLGVPVSQLTVDKGVVSGGGKSVTYGALVGGQLINATFTGKAPLKPISQYKLIGTDQQRLDIPAKVTGEYTYLHNIRVPGMLHGRIVRPQGQGEYGKPIVPLSIDASSIKQFPGVQIVRKGNFVGVVAKDEWVAIQAASTLTVKWQESPTLSGVGNLGKSLRAGKTTDTVAFSKGNIQAGRANAAKTVTRTYVAPFQTHGMIGPSAAIVDYQPNGLTTVYSHTQLPYALRDRVAKILGRTSAQVKLIRVEGSGCYGHSAYDDCALAAALMSQAVNAPVRVQFMRADEHGWDNYGPAQLTDISASIDANGKITAFDYASTQPGWMSTETTEEQNGSAVPLATGKPDLDNSGAQYALPNRRVLGRSLPNINGGVPKVIWMRAPGAQQTLFGTEQMIDELAHAAGLDPIAFRKLNISNYRWVGALDAVAKASGWTPRVANSVSQSGTIRKGRGIAIGGFSNTYAAVVADIELNMKTGKIVAQHMFAAQDAGLAISPSLIAQQMEGCLVQGTSRALLEQVVFTKNRVTSLDWVSYPILRFKDSPDVTTVVINNKAEKSSGSGEPTTAPVPAAIANAVFDATGVRMTEYPMTPARVRAALAAA